MPSIEHVAIFTHEIDVLKDFYVEYFAMRVVLDNTGAPVRGYFLADSRGVVLELIERPAEVAAVSTRYVVHIAFWVDDYAAAKERLSAGGFSFEADTEVLTEGFRTGFFADPAGNRTQIVWRERALVEV
jgi:catechol 2,3-dioxygenase-like lactoylglutathione lyase family enzyme